MIDSIFGYGDSALRLKINEIIEVINAGGAGGVAPRFVTEGDESRPDAEMVIWYDQRVDQSVAPLNIQSTDLWVTGGSVEDAENPTVPTGLASSNITDTGFTLSWSAATDNVGVTGYDVRLGTDAPVSATGLDHDFTDLTAETLYDAQARAKDAAGNVSDWAHLDVTTTAGGGGELPAAFSIYGTSAPTGTSWSLPADGTPTILFGRGFTCSSVGAQMVGGRLWIPVGATGIPDEVTFRLYGPDTGISTAVQTIAVDITGISAGTWAEGDFPVPTNMSTGQTWFISAEFTSAGDAGKYVYSAGCRPNGDPVISSMAIGDELAWVAYGTGIATQYKIGTGSATQPGSFDQSYGVDCRVTRT